MDEKTKGNVKGYLAIVILVIASFVLIFTYRGKGGGPLIPSLVSVFGIKFGLIFIISQIAYCYYFCRKNAFWWMTSSLLLGFVGGYINSTGILSVWGPTSYSVYRGVLIGGGCASGIALGIGVLKGKL